MSLRWRAFPAASERGSPWRSMATPVYTAVYELENPVIIKGAAWAKAHDTAWTAKIRPHMQNLERRVYRLILPAK
jgi:hypothetical protein